MRTFKLPGWNTFNAIIPYERADDNKPIPRKAKKKKTKKQILAEIEEFGKELSDEEEIIKADVPRNGDRYGWTRIQSILAAGDGRMVAA